MSNLLIIGCGPNYQKKYHSIIEAREDTIVLVIDLMSNQKSIEDFFSKKMHKPMAYLFLEESLRNGITEDTIERLVGKHPFLYRIDAVLICTEPKARKAYMLWACSKKIPIFADKPLTAFFKKAPYSLMKDYEEISDAASQHQVPITISCERRSHPGYLWLMDFLTDMLLTYQIPITSIDIEYAGGVCVLPIEYGKIENHPFHYGYGIVLHSGYHYVDLLAQLIELNTLVHDGFSSSQLHILATNPVDQVACVGKANYLRLDQNVSMDVLDNNTFGETDLFMIGKAIRKGRSATHFSLRLLGTSVSLRKDKVRTFSSLSGRVRQEKVSIHLGHLSSIHITSYPLHKIDPASYPIEHFQIIVMNSSHVTRYPPVISLDRFEFSRMDCQLPLTMSMNTYAKKQQLEHFLNGEKNLSPLSSHRNTVAWLDNIFAAIS